MYTWLSTKVCTNLQEIHKSPEAAWRLSVVEVFTDMLGEGSDTPILGGWGGLWRGQLGQASEGGQDLGFRPSCWAGDRKLEWRWSGEGELTVPECALSLMTSGGEWSGLPGMQITGARRLGLWRPRESLMAVHGFHHLTGPLVERDCGGHR